MGPGETPRAKRRMLRARVVAEGEQFVAGVAARVALREAPVEVLQVQGGRVDGEGGVVAEVLPPLRQAVRPADLFEGRAVHVGETEGGSGLPPLPEPFEEGVVRLVRLVVEHGHHQHRGDTDLLGAAQDARRVVGRIVAAGPQGRCRDVTAIHQSQPSLRPRRGPPCHTHSPSSPLPFSAAPRGADAHRHGVRVPSGSGTIPVLPTLRTGRGNARGEGDGNRTGTRTKRGRRERGTRAHAPV